MKKAHAVKVFGSQAEIARQLGLTRQAVQKWPPIVPYYWQFALQALSGFKLRVQPKPPRKS